MVCMYPKRPVRRVDEGYVFVCSCGLETNTVSKKHFTHLLVKRPRGWARCSTNGALIAIIRSPSTAILGKHAHDERMSSISERPPRGAFPPLPGCAMLWRSRRRPPVWNFPNLLPTSATVRRFLHRGVLPGRWRTASTRPAKDSHAADSPSRRAAQETRVQSAERDPPNPTAARVAGRPLKD